MTDFERKYRIIQYSLYGVDVMPWAIHAAELRLWLQLIIETELKGEELRKSPLLPNLNLNLRIGDSLVQEVGGVSFNVRTNDLDSSIRKKLDELKKEKRLYYENSRTARFKDLGEFKKEEIRLFEEIIENRIEKIHERVVFLQKDSKREQSTLQIKTSSKVKVKDKKRSQSKIEIQNLKDEVQKLRKIKEILKDPEKKPFVWDIDFAEIFGDKNGFDIVIGNPPYVRQEMISPPNKIKSEVTLDDKSEYKDKLIQSVNEKFDMVKKIGKRSDYYIYFYFHGLSLLNERGTFCFITSNSWLDVDYGKSLQEFLLRYVPIIAIYDNPKRSFTHADVNTIIALFGPPSIKGLSSGEMRNKINEEKPMLNYTAKFVMFKKPFEAVVNARNLIEIENIKAERGNELIELVENVVKAQDYRVFPVIQEDLLEDGWKYPKNYKLKKGRFQSGTYNINKWGAKFLRAPDIYYTILDKGKEKLLKLGDIAEVKFGIKTGVNEFFYLPSKYFDLEDEGQKYKLIPKEVDLPKNIYIEKEFFKPIIKSPKECKSITVQKDSLNYKVFMCNKSKDELESNGALDYILWGEKAGFNKRSSVRSRKYWWSLGERKISNVLCMMTYNDRHVFWKNDKYGADARLYDIYSDVPTDNLVVSLNSTNVFLEVELNGRANLGEGALDFKVYESEQIHLINPRLITNTKKIMTKLNSRNVESIFKECGLNPLKPIREQNPKPLSDRAELDNIIFDELGLTEEERKDVYWSICELVKNRLDKANSLSGG